MIIWVFESSRDHQRSVLPYQIKPPTFLNAIPIIPGEGSKVYALKQVYYRNTSTGDVCKIVSTVYGSN